MKLSIRHVCGLVASCAFLGLLSCLVFADARPPMGIKVVNAPVTAGNIPVFSGTAGYLLADSGIAVSTNSMLLPDDAELYFGTSSNYWWVYNSAGTQYELQTTDSDGGGTDAVVMSVEDGGTDVYLPGALGVGTNTPANKLHVNGAIRSEGGLTVGANTTLNGTLTVNGNSTHDSDSFKVRNTSNQNRFVIDVDGSSPEFTFFRQGTRYAAFRTDNDHSDGIELRYGGLYIEEFLEWGAYTNDTVRAERTGAKELTFSDTSSGDCTVRVIGDVIVSGDVSGKTPVTVSTNDTGTLTASGCKGTIFINGDNDPWDRTLPAAEAGLVVTFANHLYAQVITIDAGAGDKIILNDGTVLDAGDAADSNGSVDDKGTFVAVDSEYWMLFSEQNPWVDGGAD